MCHTFANRTGDSPGLNPGDDASKQRGTGHEQTVANPHDKLTKSRAEMFMFKLFKSSGRVARFRNLIYKNSNATKN